MLISVKELARNWSVKPSGVVHVGAHLGEEASAYQEFGWLPVIWLEAQPELVRMLQERLHAPAHKIIQAAIWNVNDLVLNLHVASNSQSSSLLEFGSHSTDYPEIRFTNDISVKSKRLDALIPPSEMPNFINLDIQGVEMQAIEGLGNLIEKVDYIFVEVNRHEVYVNCTKVWELDSYLMNRGFKRVITRWYLKQGWGDALYIRNTKKGKRNILQYLRSNFSQLMFYLVQFGGIFKRSLRKV
jgi:FkbM family methyltransferase